jgi:hypothetical protein
MSKNGRGKAEMGKAEMGKAESGNNYGSGRGTDVAETRNPSDQGESR